MASRELYITPNDVSISGDVLDSRFSTHMTREHAS